MMFKPVAALSVLLAATSVIASPMSIVKRVGLSNDIVYDPAITKPTAGQSWSKGSNQTVAWDLSVIPEAEQDTMGTLLLGYIENDSENLDTASPLATGFNIKDGSVAVTVPDVPEKDNYVVVLIGIVSDSGNKSKQFTITGGDSKAASAKFIPTDTSSSSTASSTATASTASTTSSPADPLSVL